MHASSCGVGTGFVEATRDVAGGANLASEADTKRPGGIWVPSSENAEGWSKTAVGADNASEPGSQPQEVEALKVGGEVARGVEEPLLSELISIQMWKQSEAVRNALSPKTGMGGCP